MKTIKLMVVLGTCFWLSGCIFPPDRRDDGQRHYQHSDHSDNGGHYNGGRGCSPDGRDNC
jgi:hypothetical protein